MLKRCVVSTEVLKKVDILRSLGEGESGTERSVTNEKLFQFGEAFFDFEDILIDVQDLSLSRAFRPGSR
jgi:hypothetical protein